MKQQTGPRRTGSVVSYRRNTRILALLALLACAAAIVSDDANESFWERHPLLAGLAASVIVVMLTVAVVNEALERRSRQRWSILPSTSCSSWSATPG
jgi:peptidoglycan/LPS O-acetylase OafA/YrhL